MNAVIAVVALRDGRSGKTRLSHDLKPASRRRLVSVLARHVVSTLVSVEAVDRVLVVTEDPAFAWSAVQGLDGRVEVLRQPGSRRGLNAAVDVGREGVRGRGTTLLVAHADLPALSRDDVAAVLEPGTPLVLAPDRVGTGTNVLVLAPAGSDFTFRFGENSLAAHRLEARTRGLEPVLVSREGTATDLDTVEDWAALPPRVRLRVQLEVPAMALLDPVSCVPALHAGARC